MLQKIAAARRAVLLVLALSATALLQACGPDAPPCNDPETTQSLLSMVQQAHDDHMKDLPYASKDLATFELDAVVPTAYDEKLKLRSCKAVFVLKLQKERAEVADRFVKVMTSALADPTQILGPFAALSTMSPSAAALDEMRQDALRLKLISQGSVSNEPVRKPLTYAIQKEEGGKNFMVSTNVDVSQTLPYLRVASRAQKMMEDERTKSAQREAEKAKKDAEIQRLSATGTWRRVVYIKDFSEAASPSGRCYERGLYCFNGFDGKDQFDTAYYQLEARKFDERGRKAMDVAYRSNQPICLVGVQKSAEPDVFTAEGFSTFLDEKGQAVDCLPGAEKQSWAETVRNGGYTVAAPTSKSSSTAVAPSAASAPENLESLITRYEPCGEEAVCLHTAKGNTIYMQASQLRHVDLAMLDAAIKSRSTVCLKDVVRTEGKSFTAESLDSRC